MQGRAGRASIVIPKLAVIGVAVVAAGLLSSPCNAQLDDSRPMTSEQAASLKRLAQAAYELDAFKFNLTRSEAD